MFKFYNKLIQTNCLILNEMLTSQKKVQLYFNQKNNIKRVIFNLKNVFFLLNYPYNLVNLVLLNNYSIFQNNKNEILYNLKIKEVFAQAKY